jgi:hypothetical protein
MPIHETDDAYIDNIKLSQDRSRNVPQFPKTQAIIKNLSVKDKRPIFDYCNGLHGRTSDSNKRTNIYSKNVIDIASRRVESKINYQRTLVDEVPKQMK